MLHKNHSCLIYDNGLFVDLATTLAKDFGKVYYYTEWASAFPRSNSILVGTGIPGVTRTNDFWGVLDDIDLFVFPDVYHGPLQEHLVNLGKRVWGSRMGEELELFRDKSKEHLKTLGLSIGRYKIVKGLDSLRSYLKLHENQWVKISRTRGDMETFHSENYKLSEPRLDELEHMLGAKKHIMDFIVEDAIDNAVEVGYDGYTIDGRFPKAGMVGIEEKDKGYIGTFRNYADIPEPVKKTNELVSPTLREYKYRNFFTLEARITKDGTPWVVDPCARFASPPGELVQIMYTNLADILWHGAAGELIEPNPAAKWGVELLLHSEWADKNWQSVQFPMKIRDNVKFRNLAVINNEYYIVPQSQGLPEIGAVVAVGDTLEEARERVKELADQVKGYFVESYPESLDDAEKKIEKLKSFGIEL